MFLGTSAISIKNVLYYRRNGSLPGTTPSHNISNPIPIHDEDDQAKYAFSSNPHDEFDEEEEAGHAGGTNYELLHDAHGADDNLHPSRQWANPSTANLGHYDNPQEIDTGYHGGNVSSSGAPQLPPHRDPFRDRSPSPYRVHDPPSEVEDTGYHGRYDPSPQRQQQPQAGDPFRDDLAMGHDHGGRGNGRVDFPHADYDRT